MSLKKKMLKTAGYAVAPKLAFLANNPKKAALAKAGMLAGGALMERMVPERFQPRRRRPSLGMMAAKGLGAAAVTVPLGWWLGRKMPDR